MKKRTIWIILLTLLIAGGFYAYREYGRTRKDSRSLKASFTVGAEELLGEFSKNEEAARKKYAGNEMIISVHGMVKALNKENSGAYIVMLGDSSSQTSVICVLDSLYQDDLKTLRLYDSASLKGKFNGYKSDDMGIGSDIELNFCVIEKK